MNYFVFICLQIDFFGTIFRKKATKKKVLFFYCFCLPCQHVIKVFIKPLSKFYPWFLTKNNSKKTPKGQMFGGVSNINKKYWHPYWYQYR